MNLSVSRRELHNKISEISTGSRANKEEHVVKYITEKFGLNLSSDYLKSFHTALRLNFFLPYYQRWEKCRRNKTIFNSKYIGWLRQEIQLPFTDIASTALPSSSSNSASVFRGRPQISFQKSSDRSKRRKVKSLRDNVGSAELSYATVMNLRAGGDKDAAKLLKEVTTTDWSKS